MGLTRGFTLIELLIVVAIIAILAAIAVPNFLEAQVRSKVSRAKEDMRSIAIGLEAYRVDSTHYPAGGAANERLNHLTTPVAFITSIPHDPFADAARDPVAWNYYREGYPYCQMEDNSWGNWCRTYNEALRRGALWWVVSRGPDRRHDAYWNVWTSPVDPETVYDPTNGTMSKGDIERFGP
jgi:type II secretion system protein G